MPFPNYRKNNIYELIGCIADETVLSSEINLSKTISESSWVRTAILTTIAGYRFENSIWVNGQAPVSIKKIKKLEQFLSFLVNEKRYHSKTFSFNIKYDDYYNSLNKPIISDDILVLSSGGVDSTAGLMHALDQGKHPIACWIDYGQPYREVEKEAVEAITNLLSIPLIVGTIDLSKYIREGESDWKHIFPARNFLLACAGMALFSSLVRHREQPASIWMCAQIEDIDTPDKSPRFFQETSSFLGLRVMSPFVKFNKTDLLAYWRRHWFERYHISPEITITCYSNSGHCGNCKACLKRAVALSVSGWPLDDELKENPFHDRNGLLKNYYLPRINNFEWKRRMDIMIALSNKYEQLNSELKKIVDSWRKIETCYMKRRLNELEEAVFI